MANIENMENYFDFTEDRVDVFCLVLDCSGSMDSEADKMRAGLEVFTSKFRNFSNKGAIAISVCKFASLFHPGEFNQVEKMDTSYGTPCGGTALYDAIGESAKFLTDYMAEVQRKKKIIPRGTLIVFSDGEDNDSCNSSSDVRKILSGLHEMGITTAFIAFGDAANRSDGIDLGFQSQQDITDKSSLQKFMGEDLSRSCQEQSKSMSHSGLGANFFEASKSSQLSGTFFSNTQSNGFSQQTEQLDEAEDDPFDGVLDI